MLLDYTKIAHLHLIDKRNMNDFIHSAESSTLTQKNSLFNQVFSYLCVIVKRSFDLMQDEEKCGLRSFLNRYLSRNKPLQVISYQQQR